MAFEREHVRWAADKNESGCYENPAQNLQYRLNSLKSIGRALFQHMCHVRACKDGLRESLGVLKARASPID